LPKYGDVNLQEIIYYSVFSSPESPPSANASLLYSLAFVFVCWLPMWLLYRKRLFLKI
jgi:predicted acyltransferase